MELKRANFSRGNEQMLQGHTVSVSREILGNSESFAKYLDSNPDLVLSEPGTSGKVRGKTADIFNKNARKP